ncbi:MAG: hypothetical protein EBU66_11450 [Bacteroidetes bacterium]|nr:hypothetical protein [Bacteroidota bacterium]
MLDHEEIVDYVFIGLGAANSLILRQMYHQGLLIDASMAIIDPDEKLLNDKTFCFWATEQELQDLGLTSLISHQWSKLGIGDMIAQSVSPYHYHHISSIALYDELRDILSTCNVRFIRERAESIKTNSGLKMFTVNTASSTVKTRYVFDSRPPQWNPPASNETFLLQSFVGWRITTKDACFDIDTFTMMDFSIDQAQSTQFVYTLPFNSHHALVELTRFGKDPISYDYAQEQLYSYCESKKFGDYTIDSTEQGVIPMSSCTIKTEQTFEKYVKTGSGAGRIKPSTGYAFKEMAHDAIDIVASIQEKQSPTRSIYRSGRFAFYDRLLLKILEQYPQRGKELFERLFQHVHGRRVLRFLEEQTSFVEDISVFMALPKYIFAKQAVIDVFYALTRTVNGVVSLGITLLFILFHHIDLGFVNWIILAIGLVMIGIPHGAMDHVLTIRDRSSRSLALFILGYIAKGMLMLAIWIMFPLAGLSIFLLYSMWHFGQAEYEQENIHNPWQIFLRGFAVLSFILATHISETNIIINALSIPSVPDVEGLLSSSLLSESTIALLLISVMLQPRKSTILATVSLILGMFLPLLQAFGVYFVFHHSFLGWNHIKNRLQKTNRELWEISAPFSLTAIATIFLFFINTGYALLDFAPLFFVILSCLSFPHVWEMHAFYTSQSITSKKQKKDIIA